MRYFFSTASIFILFVGIAHSDPIPDPSSPVTYTKEYSWTSDWAQQYITNVLNQSMRQGNVLYQPSKACYDLFWPSAEDHALWEKRNSLREKALSPGGDHASRESARAQVDSIERKLTGRPFRVNASCQGEVACMIVGGRCSPPELFLERTR